MGGLSNIWHWVLILVVVLLVFGTGKLSGLMGDAAKGIKAFKDGLKDEPEADKKTETVKSEEPKA